MDEDGVKNMTKPKIYETAFSLIEDTIGDDLYEYADNPAMVLATLAGVYGIIQATRVTLETKEKEDE